MTEEEIKAYVKDFEERLRYEINRIKQDEDKPEEFYIEMQIII